MEDDGRHALALEDTIRAGAGLIDGRHAALVELCRSLAAQMDEAEQDLEAGGPSTRLSAAYLSALKDLGRVLGAGTAAKKGGGKLAHLRAIEGGR